MSGRVTVIIRKPFNMCFLTEGGKQTGVQPTHGATQGCPLCPLLFLIHLNDTGRYF